MYIIFDVQYNYVKVKWTNGKCVYTTHFLLSDILTENIAKYIYFFLFHLIFILSLLMYMWSGKVFVLFFVIQLIEYY